MKQRSTMRWLVVGTVLAAGSSLALGQSSNENFKKPLRTRSAQGSGNNGGAGASRSTMVMRQDSGDKTVEIRVEDGTITAKVDGEEVPQDRIVRDGDQVKVMDKDGGVLSTFHVSADGTHAFGGSGAARAQKAPKAAKGGTWSPVTMDANPPKVMLGITMDAPPESLLKNYDLKDGQATVVTRVVDGLPADKAGLKENDIITEIDGKKPATQETIREVLRSKEPGDTVQLTILRKGGDKTIRITLDKYDPEKLKSLMPAPEDGAIVWDAKPLEGMGGTFDDKALKEMLKNNGQWRSFTLPGNGQGFVMGGHGDMDKKLSELDEKMADLDSKLQRVNDQINKLQALIEKLSEQRGNR